MLDPTLVTALPGYSGRPAFRRPITVCSMSSARFKMNTRVWVPPIVYFGFMRRTSATSACASGANLLLRGQMASRAARSCGAGSEGLARPLVPALRFRGPCPTRPSRWASRSGLNARTWSKRSVRTVFRKASQAVPSPPANMCHSKPRGTAAFRDDWSAWRAPAS